MTQLSAADTVVAVDKTIHDVGSAWMLDPETFHYGAEFGYEKALPFYFAGRGGVLGDVDADVVRAAMGYWHPGMVRKMWDRGIAVAGAAAAAHRYAQACARWAENHLDGLEHTDRFAELAEKVIAGVEVSGLPLFAAWRTAPLADGGPARVLQLVHVLREWRGAMHLVATTAARLGPLEAILTNEGVDQARFFGWRDELPDCSHLVDRHNRAQEMTDVLAAAGYEETLTPEERAEFAELVAVLGKRVLG
jgi:hypothetical protein